MDKDLRVRLITRQIRMKKAFALAAIILSFSNISADELFINCETASAREAVKEGKIKKPIATYKEVPKYPNAALFKGLEGRVVLGYTVNSDGTISLVEVSTDIGGSRASIAMQAAETLGIAYEDVNPTVADTDLVGYTAVG